MRYIFTKIAIIGSLFFLFSFCIHSHPIFVSVTEINYNTKTKSVEISCKIFNDDFEKALRNAYKTKVDLTDAKLSTAMNALVWQYLKNNLSINIDDTKKELLFIGYEQIEEATYCYVEIPNVQSLHKMKINNSILSDYKKEQLNIIHINYLNKLQSKRLNYPNYSWEVNF